MICFDCLFLCMILEVILFHPDLSKWSDSPLVYLGAGNVVYFFFYYVYKLDL